MGPSCVVVSGVFKCVRSLLGVSPDSGFPITVIYLEWMANKFWWIVYDFDDIIISWTD